MRPRSFLAVVALIMYASYSSMPATNGGSPSRVRCGRVSDTLTERTGTHQPVGEAHRLVQPVRAQVARLGPPKVAVFLHDAQRRQHDGPARRRPAADEPVPAVRRLHRPPADSAVLAE